MLIVRAADLASLLSGHGRDEHAVIVNEGERAVGADEDIIGLEVAVGERLREEPVGELTETPGEKPEGVGVIAMTEKPGVEHEPIDPVHDDDGVEIVGLVATIDEELIIMIGERDEERRRLETEEVRDLPIGLLPRRDIADEALESDERAVGASELEDNGEVACGEERLAVGATDEGERSELWGGEILIGLRETVDIVLDLWVDAGPAGQKIF